MADADADDDGRCCEEEDAGGEEAEDVWKGEEGG